MTDSILFVEDNEHKRSRITEYLRSVKKDIHIVEARSFTSGCQALESGAFSFYLVLLDVSLPTYDRVGSESGGRFRPFAGREIARKILRRGSKTKILFITQYDSFSDKGLSYSFVELKNRLASECSEHFAGMVFYGGSQSGWKDEISRAIQNVE